MKFLCVGIEFYFVFVYCFFELFVLRSIDEYFFVLMCSVCDVCWFLVFVWFFVFVGNYRFVVCFLFVYVIFDFFCFCNINGYEFINCGDIDYCNDEFNIWNGYCCVMLFGWSCLDFLGDFYCLNIVCEVVDIG